MSDPLRSDRPAPGDAEGRERDARIEELLLIGLDHYFAARHELAINIWTRVLFLDRSHATARAYIERARSALAEKQRQADELLHTGEAALDRGDRGAARHLLTSAARAGGGDDALNLLHRLDRLDAASPDVSGAPGTTPQARTSPSRASAPRDPRMAWVLTGIATGVLLAAVLGGYWWLVSDPFELTVVRNGVPAVRVQPLPMPSGAEIRLARARRLYARGELLAALALLESGPPDPQHTAGITELRTAIQRQLIAAGRARAGFAPLDAAGAAVPAQPTQAGGPSK